MFEKVQVFTLIMFNELQIVLRSNGFPIKF